MNYLLVDIIRFQISNLYDNKKDSDISYCPFYIEMARALIRLYAVQKGSADFGKSEDEVRNSSL